MNRILVDVGEDLFVQVYDDGVASGLSFLLQLKSCTNLESLKVNKGAAVSYQFEVADLEHWEPQSPPVVLMVWDVVLESGVWFDVPGALADLDKRSPRWRKQASANIHLPSSNSTDSHGRAALRRRIGHLTLPLVSRNKQLELSPTFEFPRDADGNAAFHALEQALDYGETATIPGKYITAFKASPWWERAMGPMPVPESITIFSSKVDQSLRMRLSATGPDRQSELKVHLQRLRAGRRLIALRNEHQGTLYKLRVNMHLEDGLLVSADASLSLGFPGSTVSETLELTRFLIALRDAGGAVLLIDDSPLADISVASFPDLLGTDELLAWERMLVKLGFVETGLSQFGRFDVGRGWADSDLRLLDQLYSIVRYGFWRGNLDFKFTMKDNWRAPEEPASGEGDSAVIVYKNGRMQLFGLTIPILEKRLEFESPRLFRAAIARAKSEGSNKVVVKSMPVKQVLIWGSPPKRKTKGKVGASKARQKRKRRKNR